MGGDGNSTPAPVQGLAPSDFWLFFWGLRAKRTPFEGAGPRGGKAIFDCPVWDGCFLFADFWVA